MESPPTCLQTDEPDAVLHDLMPLLRILYAAIEAAVNETLAYFSSVAKAAVDRALFWALFRYRLKMALQKAGYNAKRAEQRNEQEDEQDGAVQWEIEGHEVFFHHLANNGLLIWYKGRHVRIRKGHGRNPPPPTSTRQEEYYQQQKDFCQFRLDFGERTAITNLLLMWDVDREYRLRGLQLMKPSMSQSQQSAVAEWSIRVPHPADLIEADSVAEDYMYDTELPLPMKPQRKPNTND